MKKVFTILLVLALLWSTAMLPGGGARAAGCWLERTRNGYTLGADADGVVLTASRSSGSLVDKYGSYPAGNAFDGQLRTAWAEDDSGYGDGAYVQGAWAAYGGGWDVVGVALWAGYQKNNDIYYKNNRPKDVTLSLYRGDVSLGDYRITLDDYQGCQYVYFDNWLSLEDGISVRLTLHGVYGGSKYSDTCVSEIDLVLARGAASGEDEYLGDMRVYNCNEWVSLRSAPSTSAARLAKIPLGAVVYDCYRAAAGFAYGTYEGKSGYVSLDYLTPASYVHEPEEAPGEDAFEPQPEGDLYANSLYALYHGLTEAEYRETVRQFDMYSQRQKGEFASVGGLPVGRAGSFSVVGSGAEDFLADLLQHSWYEKGSSGIEPLLERARQVSLVQSEIYAWGKSPDDITNTDEYYRFKVYVPYWGGGYDLYDVLFNVGFEADGGEWAEGKVLESSHVEGLE